MGEDQQTETTPPTSRRSLPILWPTLVLLLYALSPPLSARLFGTRAAVLEIVYRPLGVVCDHVPAVRHFYQWYFALLDL
jgi:hypothetical protein